MKAIEAHSITHRYGKVTAVDDISFIVDEGELFGFIGPDGAGKTTLFSIDATLIIPSGGRMTLFGFNVVSGFRELRNHIGYMPGRFSLYQDLTVEENLNFYATIFGTTIRENYRLIEPIYRQIEPFRKRRAGRLSGGMKQKLALSCALIHKPRVLILDEPTTGVDAVSRTEFWEMLEGLKKEGITIIVSTPYMDEALRCDRIALMQQGKLLGIDTPAAIRASYGRQLWAVSHPERYRILLVLRRLPQVTGTEPFGDSVHITLREGTTPEDVLRSLGENGISGAVITAATPGIEDVFLELMKKEVGGSEGLRV
ncbi:MAG: ABC transporter ATP-binding protein [Bacteroidetes bacterium]|nr:MAG: ABC transporter ATP-binding protein [Bacteroidota bacterium]